MVVIKELVAPQLGRGKVRFLPVVFGFSPLRNPGLPEGIEVLDRVCVPLHFGPQHQGLFFFGWVVRVQFFCGSHPACWDVGIVGLLMARMSSFMDLRGMGLGGFARRDSLSVAIFLSRKKKKKEILKKCFGKAFSLWL